MHLHHYTKEAKASTSLFVTVWIAYMLVNFTKSNYLASIAFTVNEGIFTKTNAGTISAAFYLMFGISQTAGSRVTDRFSPFTSYSIGLIGSIIANIILCFSNNFYLVLIVWGFCGFIQFGIWPATSRIITQYLIPEHRQKGSLFISLCIGIAGFLSYLCVTSVLEWVGWSGVFIINTVSLVLALTLLTLIKNKSEKLLAPDISEPQKKFEKPKDGKFLPVFFTSGMFIGIFIGVFQTLLDNSAKSWVPTMIMESYSLSPTFSGLLTALIYIFNITGVFLVIYLFRKVKNEFLIRTLYFVITLPILIILQFIGKVPVWIVVAGFICFSTVLYASSPINVRIAGAFSKSGYTGTMSGIMNGFCSFGIVIGNFGYGYIAEHFGWSAVTATWLILCAMAIIIGIPTTIMWSKFKKTLEN